MNEIEEFRKPNTITLRRHVAIAVTSLGFWYVIITGLIAWLTM